MLRQVAMSTSPARFVDLVVFCPQARQRILDTWQSRQLLLRELPSSTWESFSNDIQGGLPSPVLTQAAAVTMPRTSAVCGAASMPQIPPEASWVTDLMRGFRRTSQ